MRKIQPILRKSQSSNDYALWVSRLTTKRLKSPLQIILVLTVLSLSCSLAGVSLGGATPIPITTPTNTFTPAPTHTPVTPTLTFTSTPTLVGLKTATSTPNITATTEISSVTPLALITPNTITPSVQMDGFIAVLISASEFYKGRKCDPATIKLTAQVADRDRTAHVLLFVRFRSLTSGNASEWTSIPMGTIGAGTWVHDLYSDEMKNDAFYTTAWVEYQFVATTTAAKEIGRTAIFKEKIKMLPCTLTPTPVTITP